MTSLRVAMKLSMAEAKGPLIKEVEPLRDPPIGEPFVFLNLL